MDIKRINLQRTNNLNELQRYFYEQIQQFIQGLDEKYFNTENTFIKVENTKKGAIWELKLTPQEKNNNEIDVYFTPIGINVFITGWHEDIFYAKFPREQLYKKIEEFLFFTLSRSCKIKIFKASNKPYKWSLYSFENGEWKFYSMTSSLIYNFFGKRTRQEKQSSLFEKAQYPKELFAE